MREQLPDAKASQTIPNSEQERLTIESFVAALLRGSRFDHSSGRGEEMRKWLQRSAQAWLAGERIFAGPEIKTARRNVGSNAGTAKGSS